MNICTQHNFTHLCKLINRRFKIFAEKKGKNCFKRSYFRQKIILYV
jgi:hypothetical protein